MPSIDYIGIMYEALAKPFGLLLRASDFERVRQGFYKARSEAVDPQLNQLSFRRYDCQEGNLAITIIKPNGASQDE